MKKTYINPEIDIVKIHSQQLLSGSTMGKESDTKITSESDVLGHDDDFDW